MSLSTVASSPPPTAIAAGGSQPETKGSCSKPSRGTNAPATFYTVTGGNQDIWWRCLNPARVLGANVCLIFDDQTNVLAAPHDFEPFPWRVRPDDLFEYPAHRGAAVWTRPCEWRAQHALAMQQIGIRTIAEVDDNYLSAPHLNLFTRENGYGAEGQASHLRAMGAHDAVVFATEWLRDTYQRAFRKAKRGPVPELHVCHNNALLEDWPQPEPPREDDRLRVGWMGSAQHARDIKLAYPALAWAHADGHETILMGHDVRDEEGVTHPRALAACRAWRAALSRQIPWVDPADYHRRALPFDIGLAPLELNEHTLGKSDCKAVEYAVSGAVPVLQAHPVYQQFWRHNETCLFASSPLEFVEHVRALCRSRALRDRLAQAAQEYVREQRSDELTSKEWGAAIRG